MRRSIIALVLATMAIASSAVPVVAASPKAGAPAPPDSVLEFAAGDVCDFAIRLDGWSNERVREGVDPDGNPQLTVTGNAQTLVTNLDGDASVLLRTGGSVVITDPGDATNRLQAGGRTLFWFLPQDRNPVGIGNGLFLVVGKAEQILDLEADAVTEFTFRGTARDICSELD